MLLLFAVTRALAERHGGLLEMGLLGGGFMLAMALSTFASGLACDRLGRRTIMVTAAVTGLVAIFACYLAFDTPALLVPSYLLVGGGIASIYPPLMAWLMQDGDAAGADRRLMTRRLMGFCASFNLGILSAHAGGGVLYAFLGHTGPILTAAALMVVTLALTLWPITAPATGGVPLSRAAPAQVPPAAGLTEPIDRTRAAALARLCWVANLGGTFAMSIIFNLFPRLAVDVSMTADAQGMIVGMSRAMVLAVYLAMHISSLWHDRFSAALIVHALAITGLVTIVFANSPSIFLLGLAGVAVLAGYNYFASMYYSAHGNDDERKGRAMGMHEATMAIGLAGGAVAGGIIGGVLGPRAPYALAAAVITMLAMVQIALYRRYLSGRSRNADDVIQAHDEAEQTLELADGEQ